MLESQIGIMLHVCLRLCNVLMKLLLQQDLQRLTISRWFCARTHPHGSFASLFSTIMFYIPHQTAKCCLPDLFLFFFSCPPLFCFSRSLPLNLFSLLSWLIEDVSNLTASDVMNRVNLGYLQGNVCAVCDSCTPCEWWHPSYRRRA